MGSSDSRQSNLDSDAPTLAARFARQASFVATSSLARTLANVDAKAAVVVVMMVVVVVVVVVVMVVARRDDAEVAVMMVMVVMSGDDDGDNIARRVRSPDFAPRPDGHRPPSKHGGHPGSAPAGHDSLPAVRSASAPLQPLARRSWSSTRPRLPKVRQSSYPWFFSNMLVAVSDTRPLITIQETRACSDERISHTEKSCEGSIRTMRIVGRRTASQIASASAASFLLRLT